MPTFSQGDIVRVPFPYTNRDTQQHRPALVISDGALGGGLLLWVAMITSAQNRPWPGDVPLGDGTGLTAASVIRTIKIATIEAAVAQPLGRIGDRTLTLAMAEIRSSLKLA